MPEERTTYQNLRDVAEGAGAFIDDHIDELLEALAEAIERSAEAQEDNDA